MANNRVRCLIVSIVALLVLLLIIGAVVYFLRRHPQHATVWNESCPRPRHYASDYDFDYTKNAREFQNNNSKIDQFRLTLSWSPSFCSGPRNRSNVFQCQHDFGYIVHGLWPNGKSEGNRTRSIHHHPRNCRNEQAMSIDTIRKYFCLMPSEKLMQAEWEKHGTCHWTTPEAYFEQINNLYSKIRLPTNTNEILSNSTKRERRERIARSFLDLNPQIPADSIEVSMIRKGKALKEVAFCYDLAFNYTRCP